MKKTIFITILFLLLSAGSRAQVQVPRCLLERDSMPKSWRPPVKLQQTLNPAQWSQNEAEDARSAIRAGVDEMIGFFKQKPSAVQSLWDDSIEALIQVTYSSANAQEFDTRVRNAARNNLTALITPYLNRNSKRAKCDEFEQLLPVALFAHKLYSPNDTRTTIVTKHTNAAFRDCRSLKAAMGIDYQKLLANKDARRTDLEDLFDLYIWCLWFIEAELYPGIKLPVEARKIGPAVWKYFENFHFAGASEFKKGALDEKFITIADLANHVAHIPTGVHRFPLYVEDMPDLYRFHRENFYQVMQFGDLDLFASFVDTLRQYGCTAENDIQVRDGSRFLLKLFHDSNDRWMNYQWDGETDAEPDDYDLIHHPWTAVLGLRDRQFEQPNPNTYGGIVRRWLPLPR